MELSVLASTALGEVPLHQEWADRSRAISAWYLPVIELHTLVWLEQLILVTDEQ